MPQPFQPDATLKFTVQGHAMTSNFMPPTLTIDGFPASTPPAGGSTVIPIMSGSHRLDVHSQALRRYGQASLQVLIQPGFQTEVFYAPPYHQFARGALGLVPQQRPGLGLLIGSFLLMVVSLMVVVLLVLLRLALLR